MKEELAVETFRDILDGAHNPQKTRALAKSMKELYPEIKYSLIIGMLASKDAASSLNHLLPQAAKVIATRPNVFGKPSLSAEEIKTIVNNLNPEIEVEMTQNVGESIHLAVKSAKTDDLVLITGSLYLLGEARNYWFSKEDLLWKAEYGN